MVPVVSGVAPGHPVLVATARICLPVLLTAIAIVVASVPPLAVGQTGPRQTATLAFEQDRPGRATAVGLSIDYVNPSDPAAKPHAVQKVVLSFASGTTIDTSVPALCQASNAELMANGPGACPAASRVGGGELDLDSGAPDPARILPFAVTMLNNRGELILLLESKADPRTRIVARGVIDGATITTEVSPVPGGPPDGFTAIKRVRLRVDSISAGGRSYVATPGSCPSERVWTSTVAFTYRADGVSQTVSSSSPCADATPPKPDAPACLRPASITFGLHRRAGTRVTRVAGYVNGKPWLTGSGKDIGRVTLRGLPRDGRMGVRIVATHSTGSKVVSKRTWKGCAKGKPSVRVIRRR